MEHIFGSFQAAAGPRVRKCGCLFIPV